eukprot:Skav206839  [mRNA]  locus=scaffold637:186877:191724:- [translate_table: standard]
MLIRVGEAKTPGPKEPLILGTFNPTGLRHKSSSLGQLPQGSAIWGVTETHLSRPGITQFQRELGFNCKHLQFHAGAAAPLRSKSQHAIGGKQVGTGFLTTCPSRPLVRTWDQDIHDSARISGHTFFHQNHWIHGVVIYGKASQAASPEVRDETDSLLSEATRRVVMSMEGKRFIMGDFNQEPHSLDQPKLWHSLGWRELQDLHHMHTGQEPRPTCHNKTIKDYVWLSPELVEYYRDMVYLPSIFPDHAVIGAVLAPFGPPELVPLWKQPKPFSDKVPTLRDEGYKGDPSMSLQKACTALAQQYEQRVVETCRTHQRSPPLPTQLGRATTFKPTFVPAYTQAAKPGRMGSFQPEFGGVSLQYNRWVRQLRRIESLRHAGANGGTSLSKQIHMSREWRAVLQAPGFPAGFRRWWLTRFHGKAGIILYLPEDLPRHSVVVQMCEVFHALVKDLEHQMVMAFTARAAQNRRDNPNQVFKDVRKPRVAPVQILDNSVQTTIAEVIADESAVILEPPATFHADQPIHTSAGPLSVLHAEPDKLWLASVDSVNPGMQVLQDKYVGSLVTLFEQFTDAWRERWDKHCDVPESRWDVINTFIEDHVQQCPLMEYAPIDYDRWISSLKRKPTKCATGPDGLSKHDLLALPRDLTEEILRILTAVEAGQAWPQQWITGLIHSLEKVPHASKVGQFRPICVFSLAYRNWSSIRSREAIQHIARWAPPTIFGSLPQKTAKDLWFTIQLCIEDHYFTGEQLTGCMLDLTKAFNCLPRVPLMGVCAKLGISTPVIRGWTAALSQMQRRFVVRGAVSPPLLSATGYPEGCGLSVLAMLSCNFLAVEWMRIQAPSCSLWSYVDNWEVTAGDEHDLLAGYVALQEFCTELDLQEDTAKTFFWANSPAARRTLRTHAKPLQSGARDLGAHVQYTRQTTNATIVKKIAGFDVRWGDLTRSKATFVQKLRILSNVVWANTLHGISSVHLGDTHFDHMRTQAVRALQEHHPGTSPIALLSLTAGPFSDPGYYALWHTIVDFRQYVPMSYAWAILDELSQPSTRQRPPPGPCSVLLHRLEQMGWYWDQGFRDHYGLPVCLWNCCIQELGIRVREAWQHMVFLQLEARKTFQGISHMHAGFTRRTKLLDPCKAKLLRQTMVGTFYTADRLKHREPDATERCRFCGCFDSPFHRHVECEHFQRERCLTPAQIDQLSAMPLATGSHGWFPAPKSLLPFRKKLIMLSDTTDVIHVPAHLPEVVDLFTDGSCLHSTDSYLRLATWGVACATPGGVHDHVTVASGVVPGFHQTVSRAELTGVVAALHLVLAVQRPFRLWIDNLYVWRKLSAMWGRDTWHSKLSSPNHDLLDRLFSLVQQVRHFHLGTMKIVSHQNFQSLTPIERWACAGNETADRAAEQALLSEPELRSLHSQLVAESSDLVKLIDSFHATIIAIGEKVVLTSSAASEPVDVAHPDPPEELPQDARAPPVIFQPWPMPVALPDAANRYRILDWGFIQPWLHSLQEGDQVQWWSWHQLYADFQLRCPGRGPWFNADRQRWEGGDTMPDVPFTKRSRWLTDFLQGIAKVIGLQLPWCKAHPESCVLAFWTNCINVKVGRERQQEVDRWFSATKAIFRCSKDLHLLT